MTDLPAHPHMLVVAVVLAMFGCRPSSSNTAAPGSGYTGTGSTSAAGTGSAPPAPAQPSVDAASVLPEPLRVDEAMAKLPPMKADPLIAPVATPDDRQVHGTWCLAGTGADGVVHDLAASLTSAGWTNVATRGDDTKAGVSAERDGYRASYVVSASTANACRAPGHYFASLTMFRREP